MNSDSPQTPREELEARITALLLGELTPEEAAALRQTIAQDAELAGLHDRLKQAIALVRETVASPEQALLASADAPKLPADRREKLLESFKVIRPKELARRRTVNWREWAALAAMIVGLLAVAGTLMIRSRRESFAGESQSESLFAWFDSGRSSSQRLTPLAGRGVAASAAAPPAEYEAVAAFESASSLLAKDLVPSEGKRVQISGQVAPNVPHATARFGMYIPAPAPPPVTSGKPTDSGNWVENAATASGSGRVENQPPSSRKPQSLGREVAMGDDFSMQKEYKATAADDSKLAWGAKGYRDSESRRSRNIALPEVALLDGSLMARDQDFDSKQNLTTEFFDTPAQHGNVADQQGFNERRLQEMAKIPITIGDLEGGGPVAANPSFDSFAQQPAQGPKAGGGAGGFGGMGAGGAGGAAGVARPALWMSLDSDLAIRNKDLAKIYESQSEPAKQSAPPPDPASGLPFVPGNLKQDQSAAKSGKTDLGDGRTDKYNESGLNRQLNADVKGGSSYYFRVRSDDAGQSFGQLGYDVGGPRFLPTPATPAPASPPASPSEPVATVVISDGLVDESVSLPIMTTPAPAPTAPAKGATVYSVNAVGHLKSELDPVSRPEADAPTGPESKKQMAARPAAPDSISDLQSDFISNFGVVTNAAATVITLSGRYTTNQVQVPQLEQQVKGTLGGMAGAGTLNGSINSFKSGDARGRRGDLNGEDVSLFGREESFGGIDAGQMLTAGAPSAPSESKVSASTALGAIVTLADGEKKSAAKPAQESLAMPRHRAAIVLPQQPGRESGLEREPQVQVGPVVISEIQFHPPESKETPVEERAKLSGEAKSKGAKAADHGSVAVLEPETLRKFENLRVEAQAEYEAIEAMNKQLSTMTQEEFRKAVTTATPDPVLSELLQKNAEAAKRKADLIVTYAPEHPEVKRMAGVIARIDQLIEERTESIKDGRKALTDASKARLNSLQAEVDTAKGVDIETAIARRAYFQAKRDLEKQQEVREKLNQRILSTQIENNLPKTVVGIIDQAEAKSGAKPSFWDRVRGTMGGDVERNVRISVDKDVPNVAGILSETRASQAYDPYFIQTESEQIQSKAVLEKVIEKLNLNDAWARKQGAQGKLSTEETYSLLKKKIDVRSDPKTGLIDIRAKSDQPEEAARIANTVAEVYRDYRLQHHQQLSRGGIDVLTGAYAKQNAEVVRLQQEVDRREEELRPQQADVPLPKLIAGAPVPQPEVSVVNNAFSTFSLNVSDVSFKLAGASLEKGQMPDPATVRSEEFINAFDYRDCEPQGSAPIAFAWERARYPFAHDRDLVRFSVKTAAIGRQAGRPLNLVLLLDNSGSMERADRVRIIQECLRVLAGQLQAHDRVSVVAFARTPRLWVDGLPGNQAGELAQRVGGLTPQGGTNLEDAMNLAYQTAQRHFLAQGVNRVVLLTDGAANLGDVEPESLKKKVEANRKQGIALDCFGIGWEGFNDELLEILSRNGDGRYGFVNSPEAASSEFAGQLAGALKVAASDVKVQVEFNPRRTTAYRQIGYAKHQLKKEQFRDNSVDAAEIGAAEAGNALYVVQVNPAGEGPIGTVRVRFKVPGTTDYREHEWPVPYEGAAKALEQSSAALRLAATASAFSEWLVSSPYAAEVTPDRLLAGLNGVPETWAADPRPKKLEWMIRQAKGLAGK